LARAVGDESDVHQCLDAEIPSGGAASGGRYSGTGGSRDVEVCGISAFRGVVERAHEDLDECGSPGLDLLVVQIDGIHMTEHLVLVAAVGIDGEGIKHPLGLMEGATENASLVQALPTSGNATILPAEASWTRRESGQSLFNERCVLVL
jgi:hypothetical protein